MKKIDTIVLKETRYIAIITLLMSLLLEGVLLILGKWTYRHLLGNLLGAFGGVANFFLMGLTVQNAVAKEEKEARNLIALSQAARFFFLLLIAVIGYLAPCFHILMVVIPFLFPRIAISLRPFFKKD